MICIDFILTILDFAVFFVSLHIALQALGVTRINVDGLYRYRHSVYAANLLLPCILVSLVFTKSKRPYVPEGSFCNLPIRPFGYRLALSWIPRYIVWISILSIAITIYVKTKFKLDMFEAVEMESSRSFRANSAFSHVIKKSVKEDRCKPSGQGLRVIQSMGTESNKEPQSNTFYKRFSKISWLPDQKSIADKQGTSMALSDNKNLTTTLPNSLESPLDPAESNFTPSNSRVSDTSSKAKSLAASQSEVSRLRQNTPSVHAMARSRRRIRKQLRLLFLYPVVYLLMWTIPLISHAFKYNDHYAKHPRYILTLLSVMCRILIGAIDCVVFCAREKPWRHIPGHDSTIMGSFLWWKRGGEKDRDESHRTSITALSTQDSSTMASPNPTEEISKPSKVSRRSGYYRQLSVDVCQDEINKVYERLKAEQLKNKTPDNSAS